MTCVDNKEKLRVHALMLNSFILGFRSTLLLQRLTCCKIQKMGHELCQMGQAKNEKQDHIDLENPPVKMFSSRGTQTDGEILNERGYMEGGHTSVLPLLKELEAHLQKEANKQEFMGKEKTAVFIAGPTISILFGLISWHPSEELSKQILVVLAIFTLVFSLGAILLLQVKTNNKGLKKITTAYVWLAIGFLCCFIGALICVLLPMNWVVLILPSCALIMGVTIFTVVHCS